MKANKIVITALIVLLSVLSITKYVWFEVTTWPIFEATWLVFLYTFCSMVILYLRQKISTKDLPWSLFSVFTVSFWLIWYIGENAGDNYVKIFFLSLIGGVVGVLASLIATSFLENARKM